MTYRFVRDRENYEHYASGRVFYGMPGLPAFPVRLASEVWQRCLAVRRAYGLDERCVLYDPCCGGAYHLSTLWYLHARDIRAIVGSDIDQDALALARRNLALLSRSGINKRIAEISQLLVDYGKPSHAAALASARLLCERLSALLESLSVETRLFCADTTDAATLARELGDTRIDVVFADVPYGRHSEWREWNSEHEHKESFMWRMLDALQGILPTDAVVAIAADKGQKITHERYDRLQRFRVGKRQIVILVPKH
jgi:23S rRNA (guanine2535-N1)-methyltransferase